MALQLPNWERLSFAEANPLLSGIQAGMQIAKTPFDLQHQIYANQLAKTQAQYAPLTVPAEAASKLAYANLMGPQFIAKLMANPEILANIPDPQKRALLNLVTGSGTSPLSNPFLNNPLVQNQIGATNPFQQNIPLQQPRRGTNIPVTRREAVQSAPSGEGQMFTEGQEFTGRTPEETAAINNMQPGESYTIPEAAPVTERQAAIQRVGKTWAETTGEAAGIKEEAKALGKHRADAIADLDDSYQQALDASIPLNHMVEIVKNPLFQNLRRYPGFQALQMNVKSQFGTPEEQELIGDFQATATKAVAQTVMGFRGRILDKEVSLSNQMKVSPKDTIHNMMGKLPSIVEFNEMVKQRSRIASNIMQKEHIQKGDALARADKMLNGDAIRKQVQKELENSQTITLRNPKTGEIKTIPLKEARAGGFKGG